MTLKKIEAQRGVSIFLVASLSIACEIKEIIIQYL